MNNGLKITLVFLFFAFMSCATKKEETPRSISILTFNVENLFDTAHDAGKLDYTYLPLSLKKKGLKKEVNQYCNSVKNPQWKKDCVELDWNEEKLNQKLFRVAQVISESTAGCPDVVILQEVENEKILNRLNALLPCDYQSTAISDDRDARGIDVAVFSKFKMKSFSTKSFPFSKTSPDVLKDTRGLLDVHLIVSEKIIRILGLHLPAPFHPVQMRKEALQFLETIYFKEAMPTVIAGDWNIPDKEDLEFKMMNSLRKSFALSEDVVRATSSEKGTTYYSKEGTWSFMDKIAMSRNAFDQVECKVVNFMPGQRGEKVGEPQSFPLGNRLEAGVSDHFPLLCKASY